MRQHHTYLRPDMRIQGRDPGWYDPDSLLQVKSQPKCYMTSGNLKGERGKVKRAGGPQPWA